jgi:hypothetical protein
MFKCLGHVWIRANERQRFAAMCRVGFRTRHYLPTTNIIESTNDCNPLKPAWHMSGGWQQLIE